MAMGVSCFDGNSSSIRSFWVAGEVDILTKTNANGGNISHDRQCQPTLPARVPTPSMPPTANGHPTAGHVPPNTEPRGELLPALK